ncbi:MAG: hypothetical protein QW179_01390 [Candidatus Hadarchaeales archaeon]
MVTRRSMGTTSLGVGAVIFALGIVFLLLTYLGITPNQSWLNFPWLNNYLLSLFGIIVGVLLLGFGAYMRVTVARYLKELEQREAELERKEAVAERRAKAVFRVSGKLGDRTKRLRKIEKLVRVKKKE